MYVNIRVSISLFPLDPVLYKPYLYFPLYVFPDFLDLHRHMFLPLFTLHKGSSRGVSVIVLRSEWSHSQPSGVWSVLFESAEILTLCLG